MSEKVKHERDEPDLRFPEFEGAWETENFAKLTTLKLNNGVFNDPNKTGSGYKLINVKDMYSESTINENELSLLQISSTEFLNNQVRFGDIFFTRSSLVKSGIAYSNVYLGHSEDITFDGHLIRMRPNTNHIIPKYFYYNLKTRTIRKQMVARGKTGTMTTIGQKDIISVKAHFPPLPEQQKIASFLSAMDEKIAQLEEKKNLLEDYKKGCMQQLFSQALRFKDEDGNDYPDWEEKRLAKLVELVNGLTYAPSDIREEGLLVLRSSNVKNGEINLVDKVYVCLEIDETKQTQVNDILLCVRNGSQRLIGKSAIVKYPIEKATHGAFMSVLRGSLNNYIYQLMQTSLFFREVHKNLGATINSINGSDLKKFKFNIASHPDEQQKIADFLSALDDKITHATEQLEQIKTFKKGLLQKMFV